MGEGAAGARRAGGYRRPEGRGARRALRVTLPLVLVFGIALPAAVLAGQVGTLTTFTAGGAIRAAEFNANFQALVTAIDDNYARILANLASIGNLGQLQTTAKGDLVSALNEVRLGTTGPQGPAGPQGPTGPQGATGLQGPAGATTFAAMTDKLTDANVDAGTLGGDRLAAGTVNGDRLAPASVQGDRLVDGSVSAAKLATRTRVVFRAEDAVLDADGPGGSTFVPAERSTLAQTIPALTFDVGETVLFYGIVPADYQGGSLTVELVWAADFVSAPPTWSWAVACASLTNVSTHAAPDPTTFVTGGSATAGNGRVETATVPLPGVSLPDPGRPFCLVVKRGADVALGGVHLLAVVVRESN